MPDLALLHRFVVPHEPRQDGEAGCGCRGPAVRPRSARDEIEHGAGIGVKAGAGREVKPRLGGLVPPGQPLPALERGAQPVVDPIWVGGVGALMIAILWIGAKSR